MSVCYIVANKILDNNLGNVANVISGSYYVGLSTTAILIDGTGKTEPVGNAYARVEIANDKDTFSAASSGSLVNDIEIAFVESTGAWGTITHVFLADAVSGGNVYFFEELPASKIVQDDTIVKFAASAMTFSMNNT